VIALLLESFNNPWRLLELCQNLSIQ